MLTFRKIITPLTLRMMILLCAFLLVSGTVGPRIISRGILFRDGFAVYGGLGRALIFAVIAFVLLARHGKAEITLRRWQPALLGWIGLSFAAFATSWMAVNGLLAGERSGANLVLAHGGLLLSLVFAAMGCVGPKNIRLLWQRYAREIGRAAVLAGAFYLFLLGVYALWQPLASVALAGVEWLLGLSGLHAILVPPRTLVFDKFGITVAEYCSGIESIALFTGLYVVVGVLDWKRLHKRRYFLVFPLALVVLCLLNILRIYGLIMAGYYINPEIAFSLFHTYAGMVFFILYSAVFWALAYKYLIKREVV